MDAVNLESFREGDFVWMQGLREKIAHVRVLGCVISTIRRPTTLLVKTYFHGEVLIYGRKGDLFLITSRAEIGPGDRNWRRAQVLRKGIS